MLHTWKLGSLTLLVLQPYALERNKYDPYSYSPSIRCPIHVHLPWLDQDLTDPIRATSRGGKFRNKIPQHLPLDSITRFVPYVKRPKPCPLLGYSSREIGPS